MPAVSPGKAKKLIIAGLAPPGLRVSGPLDLSGQPVTRLPEGLEVDVLDLSGCAGLRELPHGLKVNSLKVSDCTALERLPEGLTCYELEMRRTPVSELPPGLRVTYRLDMEGCAELSRLPDGLKVSVLVLRDCTALTALPERLDVYFLDISGCTRLSRWPASAGARIGCVNAQGCASLESLPETLSKLAWVDLAGTQVKSLPLSLSNVALRWHGVGVEPRIVFHPETITAREVLKERNVEKRRVMLERMGFERFITQARAGVIDEDTDPGGVRQLLSVPLRGDEPLVCLSVRCPSTGRHYVLRVPPRMRSCRQAAAWIAGFDRTKDYKPIVET